MEVFQSAPLTRGETIGGRSLAVLAGISIHSPHTRGDDLAVRDLQRGFDFNPLPSHEGRLAARCVLRVDARGISIRSPHARGDNWRYVGGILRKEFQSTPLTRGETRHGKDRKGLNAISIHSPHTRGDAMRPPAQSPQAISIHSPHARGDRARAPMPLSWP